MSVTRKAGILTFFLAGLLALHPFHVRAVDSAPSIIPQPMEMELHDGHFQLNNETTIHYGMGTLPEAEYLAEVIAPATGLALSIHPDTDE